MAEWGWGYKVTWQRGDMPARTLGYMVTWAHGLMGAGTRVGMGSRLHGLLVHGGVGPWTH